MNRVPGVPERPVDLAGCAFGVYESRPDGAILPVLFTIEGKDMLPVFSTLEKLHGAYAAAGVRAPFALKKVEATAEFLDSIPAEIPVILDPWITERGTTRFLLVRRDPPRVAP